MEKNGRNFFAECIDDQPFGPEARVQRLIIHHEMYNIIRNDKYM